MGTESWLDSSIPDALFFPTTYQTYRRDRNIHGGGIFICVREHLIAHVDYVSVSSEFLTIIVTLNNGKKVHVSVAYRPPNDNTAELFDDMLAKLLELNLDENPNQYVILGGDLNLPNLNWNLNTPLGVGNHLTLSVAKILDLEIASAAVRLCGVGKGPRPGSNPVQRAVRSTRYIRRQAVLGEAVAGARPSALPARPRHRQNVPRMPASFTRHAAQGFVLIYRPGPITFGRARSSSQAHSMAVFRTSHPLGARTSFHSASVPIPCLRPTKSFHLEGICGLLGIAVRGDDMPRHRVVWLIDIVFGKVDR